MREHPQHWGLGKLRQESMEGWIGLLKQYQRSHGNMRERWLLRGMQYLDLYCIGAIHQNQVDFAAIECNHYFRKQLMYEPGVTPLMEIETESQLPELAVTILDDIDKIKFFQEIPDSINNRLNGLLEEHRQRINLMRKAFKRLPAEKRRHQAIDEQLFAEQQKALNVITGKKVRRSRTQWMGGMQSVYDKIPSIESMVNSNLQNENLNQNSQQSNDSNDCVQKNFINYNTDDDLIM